MRTGVVSRTVTVLVPEAGAEAAREPSAKLNLQSPNKAQPETETEA